jgi:hypothetical protein
MTTVDDSGLEVLRKSAVVEAPTVYRLRTTTLLEGGDINIKAPTGPFIKSVHTIGDTVINPLAVALTDRTSLSIRNKSSSVTIYLGEDSSVTADDSSTGGWEIGPSEDFHIDLDPSNVFYLICPTGQSAIIKILQIASVSP